MIGFLQSSLLCASLDQYGVPLDYTTLYPSISVLAFLEVSPLQPSSFLSSLIFLLSLIKLLYNETRFWVTRVVIGLTIASVLKFSLLTSSFQVLLRILVRNFTSLVCSVLRNGQHY